MDDFVGEDMHIKLDKIRDVTNNFANDRFIANGGYGTVYMGLYHGQKIAVKRLHQLHGLDDRVFNNEFLNLCKIRHPNIVQLIGYCYDVQRKFLNHNGKTILGDVMERVLCFEFVEGGDLEKHIRAEPCGLNWPTCFKIIKDTCAGLHHLHTAEGKHIYHLDLKPANILLDKVKKTAKIGDLGLSRLVTSTQETQNTKGTCGYMPVEYINDGVISNKFDVFSLGVLIIKIMAGTNGNDNRSAMSREQFTELVTTKWKERLLGTSRHSSVDIFQVETCIKIALRCVDAVRDKRPEIMDIIHELERLEPRVDEISFDYPDMSQGLIGLQLMESMRLMASQPPSTVTGPPQLASPSSSGDPSSLDKISWLDPRNDSAKCYMLSSRSLHIEHVDKAIYWKWISRSDSRFAECAELIRVYFLAVIGEILTTDLSPGIIYAVYLVYKLSSDAAGLNGVQKSSVRLYGERTVATNSVSVDPAARTAAAGVVRPVSRYDGWMELKLAEFAPDDKLLLNERAVIVDFREENTLVEKRGLIVQGMEFRPID